MFAHEADEIGLPSEERKIYIKERMKEDREKEEKRRVLELVRKKNCEFWNLNRRS